MIYIKTKLTIIINCFLAVFCNPSPIASYAIFDMVLRSLKININIKQSVNYL